MFKKIIFVFFCVLILKSTAVFSQENYGTVIISEIYFDTRYNENINDRYHHVGEFIELYNSSNVPIDLDRWKIKDGHTEYEFRQTVIEPGKFLLIAYNGGWEFQFSINKLKEMFPEIEDYDPPSSCYDDCIIMQNSLILYNLTDKVSLYDSYGRLRSSVVYLNDPSMSSQDRQEALTYLRETEFDCEVEIDNGNGGVFNDEILDEYKSSIFRNSPSAFFTNGESNPNIAVGIATPFSIPFELPLLPLDPTYSVNPTSSKNYVHEIVYQEPYTALETNYDIPFDNTIQSVNYYDGLGRDLQSKSIGSTPDKKDIIVYHEYDEYGRQAKAFLPFPSDASYLGVYDSNADDNVIDYYQDTYNQDNPYSETVYENSPNDRVIEQGAPGNAWAVNLSSDTDKTIKNEYGFNTSETGEYKVRKFSVSFSSGSIESPNLVDNDEYYPANELYLTISKNENWISGKNNTIEEYKDREGRVILIRTFDDSVPHDTYNIYDKYGNLTYTLSPKVLLDDGISSDELNALCYQYVYDNQFRVVEKKLPGKGREYTIYDTLDRPILVQDSEQRELSPKEWSFTKFDIFGRSTYSGIYQNNDSRNALQNFVTSNINSGALDLYESKTASVTNITSDPFTVIYYTTNAFPNTGNRTIHSINYYDDYNFDIPTELNNPIEVFEQEVFVNISGLDAGSKTRVIGTNNWITSINYYDYKSRPIFNGIKNLYINTTTISKTKLDFSGRLAESETYHRKGSTAPIICYNKFNYDHVGRLISQTKSINGGEEKLVFENTYDELGKLIKEKINPKIQSPLLLTNDLGVTIIDNYVLKTSPNGWSNAAFTSDNTLSGNGYVEFEVKNAAHYAMLGLSNPNTVAHYSSIKYAIYTYGGNLRVRHNGVPTSHGTYQAGDKLRVERINDKIIYKKNGIAFYEVITNDFSNLIVDASLFHDNTQIDNIVFKSNGLQNIDYNYNIRDWTTKINDIDNLNDDLFSLKINYDQTDYASSEALYNGDISELLWNTSSIDPATGESQIKRAYIYSYDDLNRIVKGTYKKEGGVNHNNYFNLNEVTYDKNSNISTLKRSGVHPTTNVFINAMDNMTYTYIGNQLTDVLEEGNHYVGFADKTNTQTGDYDYDSNGNLIEDINKSIESIEYNYLNLPTKINFGALGTIEYKYAANGSKIEKKVIIPGSGTETLHYSGGYVYKNGTLNFFPQEKGYIIPEFGTYKYVYQFKDHLGSVRLSYTDVNNNGFILSDEIIEENNFHPFGLKHYGYNNNITSSGSDIANRFKFSGKELDVSLGLTTYDFGARNYDPAIARWSNVDNYSESFKALSPYNYAVNNPISFVDPDGNYSYHAGQVGVMNALHDHYNNAMGVMNNQIAFAQYSKSMMAKLDQGYTPQELGYDSYDQMQTAMNSRDYQVQMENYYGGLPDSHPGKQTWKWSMGQMATQSTGDIGGGISKADVFEGLQMITGSKDWTDGTMALIDGDYGAAAKHYAWGSSGLLLRGAPAAIGSLRRLRGLRTLRNNSSNLARSWQGSGNYPGVDNYRNITLNQGKHVVGGLPGQSEYYTTLSGLNRSGLSAEKLWKGLQVSPHPQFGYRNSVGIYRINSRTNAAFGTTYANPQYGPGGLPQIFIPDYSNLTLIRTIPLR